MDKVQLSVMPKGVEHWDPMTWAALLSGVQLSVMPKGVEHFTHPVNFQRACAVQLSVMPKGVEHASLRTSCVNGRDGATISDAERR